MPRLPLLSALLLSLAAAAHAERAPSPAELESLGKDAAAFARNTERNRAGRVIDALPERVIPAVAQQANTPPKLIRDTLVDQARAFGKSAQPEEVVADLSGVMLDEAGGLTWGVVRLKGTSLFSGQRVRFDTATIAILEDGDWHFARIDTQAQADLIRAAYPEITELSPGR
ncbi:hypothetical protein [Mangrovicoccus algicola]|uniref:DUF4440 domain-containing protein n=1 Tax=Mangrovicoccus algicola TaxID=2771008 RepID=A0A8J6YZ83_9RHOB|nr:hypothetical protein [Mangrovicoccus algicola]MBE3640537.1 hypothetical protein [Mangrovicoccus algicola]